MGAKERGVLDLLNLSTIRRWQIVEMLRDQSVAEHSFRVWVLTRDLWTQMVDTEHNSFEKDMAFTWSLLHDADEVYTGDIPSTVKRTLNEIHPGITEQLKDQVLVNNMPDVIRRIRGIRKTLAYYVVKIADTVETIMYLKRYAVGDPSEVYRFQLKILTDTLTDCEQRFKTIQWDRARAWVAELLNTSPDEV